MPAQSSAEKWEANRWAQRDPVKDRAQETEHFMGAHSGNNNPVPLDGINPSMKKGPPPS